MPNCLSCNKNFHYCGSCGYYEDSDRGYCYGCWCKSGAAEGYSTFERDENYELTEESEAKIQELLSNYSKTL